MVKAVNLIFCSIREHFIRDIHAKFGISNLPPVSRYWAKLKKGYFQFTNFWAIPYKRNPLYSDNIDMKLGPVTKLDREAKQQQKNMTMTSYWQIVMSLSLSLSVKLTFSLIVTFYLTKLKTDLKHSSHTIDLGKGTIFC